MRFLLAFAAALCLIPIMAMARPPAILCSMSSTGAGNWIPHEVVFLHLPGAETATVNDPIIQYYMKKPLEAKVTADSAKRLSLSWSVIATASSGNRVRVRYSLTMQKANLHVSMTAKPDGADNSDSAGGSCKTQ